MVAFVLYQAKITDLAIAESMRAYRYCFAILWRIIRQEA